MGKCYVLGAGFSKSVAGLPLMRELPERFREIQRTEACCGHSNRAGQGADLLRFFEWYKEQVLAARRLGPDEKYGECGAVIDIEAISTFLDFNRIYSPRFDVAHSDGGSSSVESNGPLCRGFNVQEIKQYLQTYLYLALNGPYPNPSHERLGKFVQRLSAGDIVITFNYDLVLERELCRQGRWDARDGYGLRFVADEDIAPTRKSSQVKVLKLHGSLNWQAGNMLQSGVRLSREWLEDGFFAGVIGDTSGSDAGRYQGGFDPCWVLPSWMKCFTMPELLSVWGQARRAIEASDEIVMVGYSFPEADSSAILLFADSGLARKTMTIVDPDYENLVCRLKKIFLDIPEPHAFRCLDEYLVASDSGRSELP